jgi:NSS family neurotransmitter:Na+ symporter
MKAQRESWSARSGFIFAAVGSAIGLGNIWRFPYVAYENGGGAFLIPYLIALLTAGLPLLFLDYNVGHKFKGASPIAYKRMHKPAEMIGWWQMGVCFFIGLYYASVLAWAGSYIYFSFGQQWQHNPEHFFNAEYLQSSGGTLNFTIIPHLFFPLAAVWAIVLGILSLGVQKGLEWANKIFIPLLIVLFGILVIQALRLPGAVAGLNAFFTPNWHAMTDYKVWLAAYGHIFFSLSVGFGIMVTYASYLAPKSNLTGAGLVVGFANSSFEILAGIGVFAALGFMAHSQGVPVNEVVEGGIGLAFIAFPKLISSLGASGDWFGVMFFGSLSIAGITSLVSVMQVPISALQDKIGCSRRRAVILIGGGTAILSTLLFSTRSAITLVDIIDHFINNIGIVGGGLLSIITVSWFKRSLLRQLIDHNNRISSVKLGKLWVFMVTVVTPLVLITTMLLTIKALFLNGYGDYSTTIVTVIGWGSLLCCALGAVALCYLPEKSTYSSETQASRSKENTDEH